MPDGAAQAFFTLPSHAPVPRQQPEHRAGHLLPVRAQQPALERLLYQGEELALRAGSHRPAGVLLDS